MSNLLKGFYVAVDKNDKRVIDSNDIISEKLVLIKNTMKDDGISGDGFSAGLNPIDVSNVLDEDSQIIGNEAVSENEVIENPIKNEVLIAEAEAEAEEIVSRANEDARAIIDNAKAEAEQILNQARETGYTEGLAAAKADADMMAIQARNRFEEEKQQIVAEYRKKEEELEPALVDTILNIFVDITKAISADKRDMILTLVNNVMSGGEASTNFIIRACNEDAKFLRENKDRIIGAVRKDIHIEIVADPTMVRNQCLIDTDTGVYDCSLDIQLENLVNDIRILSATGE